MQLLMLLLSRVEQIFVQLNPANSKSEQRPLKSGMDEIKSDASNFWYENINHNGESPFIPNGDTWKAFRNVVTDYGADNTGGRDATKNIAAAINGKWLNTYVKNMSLKL
jgi:hypothetical protein